MDNKQIVIAFFEQAFNEREPELAVEKYLGDPYIQHNPGAGDGPEPFLGYMRWVLGANPHLHVDIKKVIAEGDYVVTHSNLRNEPGDLGMAVADFFRLKDGKIVEHWDVIQDVPAESANNNTMF